MKRIKNKLQQKIKVIKTTFIRMLCVSLKRDDNTEKCFCENEKICKFEKIFKNMVWNLGFILKKVLNIEEFKKVDEIVQYIKDIVPEEDLSVGKTIFLEKTNNIQLFVLFGKTEVFVVKDDGFNVNIIFRIEKEKFKYHIINQDSKPRLYIEDTITTLPINTNYSGSTSIIEFKIKKFTQE